MTFWRRIAEWVFPVYRDPFEEAGIERPKPLVGVVVDRDELAALEDERDELRERLTKEESDHLHENILRDAATAELNAEVIKLRGYCERWEAQYDEHANKTNAALREVSELRERLTSAADALEVERTRAGNAERLAARAEEDLGKERAKCTAIAGKLKSAKTQVETDKKRLAQQLASFIEDTGLKNEIWCGWTYPNHLLEPALVDTAPLSEQEGLPQTSRVIVVDEVDEQAVDCGVRRAGVHSTPIPEAIQARVTEAIRKAGVHPD
jgi:hypothetical protein